MARAPFALGLLFVIATAQACGPAGEGPAAGCVPGRLRACACVDGSMGDQLCATDRRYAACQCGTPSVDASPADVISAARDGDHADLGAPTAAIAGCPGGTTCDLDGDRSPGPQCGGADCDDRDCRRYLGATERCDPDDLDEDCDPCTVAGPGDGDRDHDTFVADTCRNRMSDPPRVCDPLRVRVDPAMSLVTGRDCADEDGNRHPDQGEVCNGRDDNCNAGVDEDFRGGPCGTGALGVCGAGVNQCSGGLLTCVATVTVGARAETCNGLDDDCDGSIDEGVVTGASCRITDGPTAPTSPCREGRLACLAGREVCVNPNLRDERCNGLDDDCDGLIDEAPEADRACTLAGAAARCMAGACVVVNCERGLGDCDRNTVNGCEADLASDRSHCGGCGSVCAGRCTNGWCDTDRQELVAGRAHTCAARGRGSVVCWGSNATGQIGDGRGGMDATARRPTAAVGVTSAVGLGAGGGTLARLAMGRAMGWGYATLLPADLGLNDVVAVGGDCTARANGDISCWDGSGFRALAPLGEVRSLAGASCALQGAGAVRCRTTGDPRSPWALVALPSLATEVCAGDGYACALTVDRRLWCWGDNSLGQLGDGTTVTRGGPGAVPLPGEVVGMGCGARHACAVQGDGAVYCWGDDSSGQLGQGFPVPYREMPLLVSFRTTVPAAGLACGAAHSCARLRDGRVYCWGANEEGQLGNGAYTLRSEPVAVDGY